MFSYLKSPAVGMRNYFQSLELITEDSKTSSSSSSSIIENHKPGLVNDNPSSVHSPNNWGLIFLANNSIELKDKVFSSTIQESAVNEFLDPGIVAREINNYFDDNFTSDGLKFEFDLPAIVPAESGDAFRQDLDSLITYLNEPSRYYAPESLGALKYDYDQLRSGDTADAYKVTLKNEGKEEYFALKLYKKSDRLYGGSGLYGAIPETLSLINLTQAENPKENCINLPKLYAAKISASKYQPSWMFKEWLGGETDIPSREGKSLLEICRDRNLLLLDAKIENGVMPKSENAFISGNYLINKIATNTLWFDILIYSPEHVKASSKKEASRYPISKFPPKEDCLSEGMLKAADYAGSKSLISRYGQEHSDRAEQWFLKLLNEGVNINYQGLESIPDRYDLTYEERERETALMKIVKNGNQKLFDQIIDRPDLDVNLLTRNGLDAIFFCLDSPEASPEMLEKLRACLESW